MWELTTQAKEDPGTANDHHQTQDGWENISNLEACITRIRLDAANTDLIDEAKLRAAGAFDVVIVGDAVPGRHWPRFRGSSTKCSPAGDTLRLRTPSQRTSWR